ncbi:hypothetical protein ACER0C_002991 [Sarotherodon galilaeus]
MTELVIVAIDFGTAYSGYAFSLTPSGAEIDPFLKTWGKELGLDTPKTPTCILFNEDKEFVKFGYEAKTIYINMQEEEAKKNYFFENFKMMLYGKKLSKDVLFKAANGKSMKALKVFTEALRYMRKDAIKTINTNTEGRKFIPSDFTWVLTVPAIWDSSAKQFMREAAAQAGIITEGTQEKLIIALEPEAASVWCKKLPADGFITQNHDGGSLSQGTQFMVVDCGGGTIDITVHKVLDGGALEELHKASGNNLGGQTVDRKFKEFLREIFGHGVWDEYERNFPSEVQRIMNEFMFLKKGDDDVMIMCPFNLGTLVQKKKRQEIEKFFEKVQGASWDDGSIKISKEKLDTFFADSLKGIIDSIRETLNKHLNIEYILLVGGYAESKILRQCVIGQFGDQCKVLCPYKPQEVILKGAVQLGKNPAVVASRKSAFTYGVSVCEKFDELKHREDKKFAADGEEFCSDIFMTLLEEGENVGWNEVRRLNFNPVSAGQTGMEIKFYHTHKKNPMYTDEDGVKEVGSLSFRMPTTCGKNHEVKLEIKFGSSNIRVSGTGLVSDVKKSVKMDFMTKA